MALTPVKNKCIDIPYILITYVWYFCHSSNEVIFNMHVKSPRTVHNALTNVKICMYYRLDIDIEIYKDIIARDIDTCTCFKRTHNKDVKEDYTWFCFTDKMH